MNSYIELIYFSKKKLKFYQKWSKIPNYIQINPSACHIKTARGPNHKAITLVNTPFSSPKVITNYTALKNALQGQRSDGEKCHLVTQLFQSANL